MSNKDTIDCAESKQFNAVLLNHFLEKLRTYLCEDDEITEICLNRPNEIFKKNGIWQKETIDADLDYLTSLATATTKYNSQDINDTRPILSAELPKGERIQICNVSCLRVSYAFYYHS